MNDKPLSETTNEEFSERLKTATSELNELHGLLDRTRKKVEESDELYKLLKTPHARIKIVLDRLLSETSEKLVETDRKLNHLNEKEKQLDELMNKARAILPEATSAGLATNYKEAHEMMETGYYWIGFIISLAVLLAGYTYFLLWPIYLDSEHKFKWLNLAVSTTSGVPLFWIAWYCQKSISQIKRIKEEYNHKYRIMMMYGGFSQQIDELKEGDVIKKQLISAMLSAIVKNPAETLGQPRTILESFKNQDSG